MSEANKVKDTAKTKAKKEKEDVKENIAKANKTLLVGGQKGKEAVKKGKDVVKGKVKESAKKVNNISKEVKEEVKEKTEKGKAKATKRNE